LNKFNAYDELVIDSRIYELLKYLKHYLNTINKYNKYNMYFSSGLCTQTTRKLVVRLKPCVLDARNPSKISGEERIDQSHCSIGELFKCDWSILSSSEISDRFLAS